MIKTRRYTITFYHRKVDGEILTDRIRLSMPVDFTKEQVKATEQYIEELADVHEVIFAGRHRILF